MPCACGQENEVICYPHIHLNVNRETVKCNLEIICPCCKQIHTHIEYYTHNHMKYYTWACTRARTHTHTHFHIEYLAIQQFLCWINATSFQIGNFGKWEFWGTLESILLSFGARRRRRRKKTHGLLFSHAFVEAHAGYTAAAASPYKKISCYKTCLSHTRSRRMISDFRRSCFCPQVVTNRLLLVVGC